MCGPRPPSTGAFPRKRESLSTASKVKINKLPTGVPGLNEILGGGLPEFSFNIIAGAPGSGKTTLAHQIAFANATPERPALYFTILGEPAIKMLRYQQQYTFFDQAKLNNSVRFINLSQVVLEKDLDAVLEEITKEVEKASPGVVVVDSFRTVVRKAQGGTTEVELQSFIQRLALLLTSWQATTFLVGEYVEGEIRDNPVFTVSDGLFWLYQAAERSSIVRKLQIVKLRGQASVQFHCAKATDRETARAGVRARTAHLPHYPCRAASVFAYSWAGRTSKEDTQYTAPFHRYSGIGQDAGRGHSRRR